MNSQFEILLKDMSFNSKFRFLDVAKDQDKLFEIAKNKGIVLPAHDLAVFECIYAFVDRQNKNGCTLPKEEVAKSLQTLNGKSIDLDHFRKSVVGHWIDAKVEGDKIIAYGAIFRGSFEKDYELIKELFDKGNLSVSFEAWGNREFNDKGGYSLTEIEFAGGALLLKSDPAFEGADVLELAKKNRVLEFAKVMNAPETYVHDKSSTASDTSLKLEESRFYVYDTSQIMNSLSQVECLGCKEPGMMDPMMIDYSNNQAKVKCMNCDAEMAVDLTPAAILSKKGRKIKKMTDWATAPDASQLSDFINDESYSDERIELSIEQALSPIPKMSNIQRLELTDEDFAIVKTIELSKDKKRKIRVLPIHNLAQINYAKTNIQSDLVISFLDQLGITKDTVERKITRRVVNISMKDLLEKYKKSNASEVIQEVAKLTIKRELTKEELEKAQLSVVNLQTIGKGKGGASDQSLQALSTVTPANDNGGKDSKAPANETSLQNATISEDEIKSIISEVVKVEAKVEKIEESSVVIELKAKLDELTKSFSEATAKLKAFEDAKAAAEKAELDAKIASRKGELAEFAKDMSDADILDEVKYELAKLKKENSELKAGKFVPKKQEQAKAKIELVKGSEDKTVTTEEVAARSNINRYAFGELENKSSKEDQE